MSTRGATISASNHGRGFRRYFFGRRLVDFWGAVALFRLSKKSPRFGTGISAPRFVF